MTLLDMFTLTPAPVPKTARIFVQGTEKKPQTLPIDSKDPATRNSQRKAWQKDYYERYKGNRPKRAP